MIKSYLSERWQHKNVKGTCTDDELILTGVFQGSIIGPFLFLLHMNDLDASSSDSKVTTFADDATLLEV